MRTRHVLAATAALALAGGTAGAALTGASAAPAHHKAKPTVGVVAKKLVGPLSVAQAPDGTRYWADSFAGPALQAGSRRPADGGLRRLEEGRRGGRLGRRRRASLHHR